MHALLAKEFRLVVHPATYMLVVLGALVLIPSWPYAVIILYGILMAFFNAQNAREMRDLSYSFALPASRRDMVRGDRVRHDHHRAGDDGDHGAVHLPAPRSRH